METEIGKSVWSNFNSSQSIYRVMDVMDEKNGWTKLDSNLNSDFPEKYSEIENLMFRKGELTDEVLASIERGLVDIQSGRVLSDEEARKIIQEKYFRNSPPN